MRGLVCSVESSTTRARSWHRENHDDIYQRNHKRNEALVVEPKSKAWCSWFNWEFCILWWGIDVQYCRLWGHHQSKGLAHSVWDRPNITWSKIFDFSRSTLSSCDHTVIVSKFFRPPPPPSSKPYGIPLRVKLLVVASKVTRGSE